MEEEEDTRIPTLEADMPTIEYEGELKESTLEVNMHHFYHGDPNKIHEFALQDAIPYESSEDDTSSGEDSSLQELEQLLKGMKTFLESICSSLLTKEICPRVRPMKEWMRC
jgi:hypothetical protein